MTKVMPLPVLLCLALAVSGCNQMNGQSASAANPQFVAANSSEVLVDINHGADTDLTGARQIAAQKCALFSKKSAVLSSINPVTDDKDRLSFACE
jgi:hypothetical protein